MPWQTVLPSHGLVASHQAVIKPCPRLRVDAVMSVADHLSEFHQFFEQSVYDVNFEERLRYTLHRHFPPGSDVTGILSFLDTEHYSQLEVSRSPQIIAYERAYPVKHPRLQYQNKPAATLRCRILVHVNADKQIDDIRTKIRVSAP
jgi:hypothetical protein